MTALERRLAQLEQKMNLKNESTKRLSVIIFDERYVDILTPEFLQEHYPGFRDYLTLYLPDNGRCSKKHDGPYQIDIL